MFETYIDRFVERYSEASFTQDLTLLPAETDKRIIENAKAYFAAKRNETKIKKSNKEAVVSVRLGGISTRTIRNWKRGENIYSERSSTIINDLIETNLPEGVLIRRRRLSYFWMAFRLLMSDAEAVQFFQQVVGENAPYVLNLQEATLKFALCANRNAPYDCGDFFAILRRGVKISTEAEHESSPVALYTKRVMEELQLYRGDVRHLRITFLELYEEALSTKLDLLKMMDLQAPASVTKFLDDLFPHASGSSEIKDMDFHEGAISFGEWANFSKAYQQATYFSIFLELLGLLIRFVESCLGDEGGYGFYEYWYYEQVRATGRMGSNYNKISGIDALADDFARNGELFSKIAKEKGIRYFKGLFQFPIVISRKTLIEFCAIATRGSAKKQEVEAILSRHGFLEI